MLDKIKIAWLGKHFGEEPPLVGNEKQGAGTIFFTGCNLACVFCQNYQISQQGIGAYYSIEQLADTMLELQKQDAVNIDLVSPTIWWKQIQKAILIAKEKRLKIPIVWNSNGYEKIETIKEMAGLVDIYLPDFKYGNDSVAFKYSNAKNYTQTAINAIKEMWEQVGQLKLNKNGLAKKGLIVRHLILPNNLQNSFKALEMLAQISTDIHVSLMNQYSPLFKASLFPEINQDLKDDEFEQVYKKFIGLGFKNGWVQEKTSSQSLVPDFTKKMPFG